MLDSGKVYLGGCCIFPGAPQYHCNACGAEFGEIDLPHFHEDLRLKSIVFGTAVGDAMGVPFEFKERDTLHCTHPVGNGTYDMSAGTFSDDTSLRDAMKGVDLKKAIEDNIPDDDRFAFLHDVASRSRDKVPSSGFVLDTLEAALWCNLHTESYAECVQEAVNLGDDTDTTACVAGALSGAIHGYRSIPENWLNTLRGKKMMKGCLF